LTLANMGDLKLSLGASVPNLKSVSMGQIIMDILMDLLIAEE